MILQLSVDRLEAQIVERRRRRSVAPTRQGWWLGSFFRAPGVRSHAPARSDPFDYLVALVAGEAVARDSTGDSATLVPGMAALWRGSDASSDASWVEALLPMRGLTVQSRGGETLDVSAIQEEYS